MHVQPGAVKLVLWRQWIHQPISLHQAVQVTAENQFHCTRLYTPSGMQPNNIHAGVTLKKKLLLGTQTACHSDSKYKMFIQIDTSRK